MVIILNAILFYETDDLAQSAFNCSKLTIETQEQAVKYAQS